LSKLGGLGEIESLRAELTDRFGPPPAEVVRLLAGAALRVLGTAVGVEKIYVRDRSARLSFREEVVPKLAALDAPLRTHRTSLEVRRVRPLSVRFEQQGSEPIMETLTVALAALKTAGAAT
jgi:transcription-repair coupling factor (superfamily II helicase)